MFSPSYEILSTLTAHGIIAKDILQTLRGIVVNGRRDKKKVDADYDLGIWRSALEQKSWLQFETLKEYLISNGKNVITAKIQNRLIRIKTSDYYTFRLHKLQDVLKEYAGQSQELVELGCGIGTNLFSLFLTDQWQYLTGFDISENSIQAARETAEHFNTPHILFGKLDLTNGRDSNFKKLQGKTIFTYYCLEQLKYDTSTVIKNILKVGVKRVIQIEPTWELLKATSLKDWATFFYILRMDYQNNLLRTLKNFEKQNKLKILDVKRLYYAPTLRNDPTLICWEPTLYAAK